MTKWIKGVSPHPEGRPKSQTTLQAYKENRLRFINWERFCWALVTPPYTGASAARKAGYSPKSARFIASRLKRNPVVRHILKEHRAMVELYGITDNMEFSTTGDVIEKLESINKRIGELRTEPVKIADKRQHFPERCK